MCVCGWCAEMCFVSSSTELIELFLLNSWELLGCGQMPLGTRCVYVCVCVYLSVCVHWGACAPFCLSDWESLLLKWKLVCLYVYMCVCAYPAGRWSVSGIFSGLQASLVPWLSHRAVWVELFIKLCLEYSGHMCATATDESWAGADGVCLCARRSGVVMERSRPDRDVTQQQDPMLSPLSPTHTHIEKHTLVSITFSDSPLGSCLSWKKLFLLGKKCKIIQNRARIALHYISAIMF